MRLYKATGEKRYADLAKYFIDEHGKCTDDNNYYDIERKFYRLISNLDGYVYDRIDYLKDTDNLNGIVEYL